MPYVSGVDNAIHLITFPTKGSIPKSSAPCTIIDVASPFFYDNADETKDFCLMFQTTNFDLKENYNSTPVSGDDRTDWLCNEVNFLAPNEFPAGWSNYLFTYTNGDVFDLYTYSSNLYGDELYYEGAPAIVTWLYNGPSGLSSGYGAWSDAYVSDSFYGNILFYQYIPTIN
jgi:hypothetical protein